MLAYKDNVKSLHACSQAKLVSMGVSVAGMVLATPIQMYDRKDLFDSAITASKASTLYL
jgi:hypothetical protein